MEGAGERERERDVEAELPGACGKQQEREKGLWWEPCSIRGASTMGTDPQHHRKTERERGMGVRRQG